MTRFLAFLLLAAAAVAPVQAAQRNFTVTSFDRIRMEAPFDVILVTGKPPSAKADGPMAALDTIDLQVEGRTLIVRQKSGWNGQGKGVPVRITLSTPDLRTATLLGSGRLAIDRMKGLSVSLAMASSGQLKVGDLRADNLDLLAGGSGVVSLAGAVKKFRLNTEGAVILDAASLVSDELVLIATGNSEVRAAPRRTANLNLSGVTTVALATPVACVVKVTGAATVTGCR